MLTLTPLIIKIALDQTWICNLIIVWGILNGEHFVFEDRNKRSVFVTISNKNT